MRRATQLGIKVRQVKRQVARCRKHAPSGLAYFPFEGGVDVPQKEAEERFWGILKAHGFEKVGILNEGDTQGFVTIMGECAFLIYRGSESMGDWVDNIDCLLDDGHNGSSSKLHRGFLRQFKDADRKVKGYLEQAGGKQLYIGGQSLGGALANLATLFYADHNSGATYTFGAPPVSTADLQNEIKTPIYRIVNQQDPVPVMHHSFLALMGGWVIRGLGGSRWWKWAKRYVNDVSKMRQIGHEVRIVMGESGPEVRHSVGVLDRLFIWLHIGLPGSIKRNWKYHDKALYEKHLRLWAQRRQKP